jgi:hypothetical protein
MINGQCEDGAGRVTGTGGEVVTVLVVMLTMSHDRSQQSTGLDVLLRRLHTIGQTTDGNAHVYTSSGEKRVSMRQ